MSDECTCHLDPPCPFCLSLNEEEADIMANGGIDALRQYREDLESGFFSQDNQGDTPLHLMARKGELWLLDRGSISQYVLNLRNQAGDTIVHEAALNGELGILMENVAATFTAPGKPAVFRSYHLEEADTDGFTPVHFAAMYGHLDQVKSHLTLEMMTTPDAAGRTPLDHAIARGHRDQAVEIVSEQLLTPAKSSTTNKKTIGQNLIFKRKAGCIAAAFTKENLGTILPDTSTLMHTLALAHGLDLVASLLTTRLLAAQNKDGWNPVHVAAACGSLNQIPAKLLIPSVLAANCNDPRNNVLHVAAASGHLGQLPEDALSPELLAEVNRDGQNTAHLAAANGLLHKYPEHVLTRDLLNARDAEGRTVFDLVRDCNLRDELPQSIWAMETAQPLPLPSDQVGSGASSREIATVGAHR